MTKPAAIRRISEPASPAMAAAAVVAALMLAGLFAGTAAAAVNTWQGTNTAWATPGNWSLGIVPDATHDVVIDGGGTAQPILDFNVSGSPGLTIASLSVGETAAATLTFHNGNVTDKRLIVNGNVTVGKNGVLTHTANSTTAAGVVHRLFLDGGGNLTVVSGGTINVSRKGYEGRQGPGASSDNYKGGTHGGEGGSDNEKPTYGSVTAPVNLGSGGGVSATWGGPGGGAASLRVAGSALIDGRILADGGPGPSRDYGTGSGGSVLVEAASLSGTGVVSAVGWGPNNNYGCGGGGRISIVLSAGTDFGAITIRAHGGDSSVASRRGGAGTIYLEPFGLDYGTLIVDNHEIAASARCSISREVADTEVGDVILRRQGGLHIAEDQSLTVYGSWSNAASLAAASGSRVEFAGTNTATLWGDTTFAHWHCEVSGKILRFEASKTQTVTEGFRLAGAAGNELTLISTDAVSAWNLVQDVEHYVRYVTVSDSNAGAGGYVTALDSTDDGGNTHWLFGTPQTMTWTGADGPLWQDPANWNPARLPAYDDPLIVIAGGMPNQPTLDVARTFGGVLSIESGATLTLNGNDLGIYGNVTNAGTLVATDREIIAFRGDATFSGGILTAAASTLLVDGAVAQQLILDGNIAHNLVVSNVAPIRFLDDVTAMTFECRLPTAALTFQAGSTMTLTNLLLLGQAGTPVTLRSSNPGSRWQLKLSAWHAVRHVDVRDSEATGKTIYAANSGDLAGNNVNWDFDTRVWNGSVNTAFDNASNWTPAGVPGAGDAVLVCGAYTYELMVSAPWEIGRLSVGIENGSAVTLNQPLSVNDDILFGSRALIRHSGPSGLSGNRVNITVQGDAFLHAGSVINLNERGYSAMEGPGKGAGGSYGGSGGLTTGNTYGSVSAPIELGSGSTGATTKGPGGGAAQLTVAGTTVIDGLITANGGRGTSNNHSGGSGGSIYITTGHLYGTGILRANGGIGNSSNGSGGGGRIAVILTNGMTFGQIVMAALGASPATPGAAGTIYLRRGDQAQGALIIDNNNVNAAAATEMGTNVTDAVVGDVSIRNQGRLAVAIGRTLEVYGNWSNAVPANPVGGDGSVVLAGAAPATVWGNTAWQNLTIATHGKTVRFQAGATQTINGVPTFENVVWLLSTVPGSQWKLVKPGVAGEEQPVGAVVVQDSDASGGKTFVAGLGSASLGNNLNWTFPPRGSIMSVR